MTCACSTNEKGEVTSACGAHMGWLHYCRRSQPLGREGEGARQGENRPRISNQKGQLFREATGQMKLSSEQILNGWLSQSRFEDHFYAKSLQPQTTYLAQLENSAMVHCKCTSFHFGSCYSGVAFFWVQDAVVLARPPAFYLNNLPPPKFTNLGDPNCFALMEERLKVLHDFFKEERRKVRL